MVLPSLFIHEILDFLKVPTKGRDAGKKVTVDFFRVFGVSYRLRKKPKECGRREEKNRFLSWPTLKKIGSSKGNGTFKRMVVSKIFKILTPILGEMIQFD